MLGVSGLLGSSGDGAAAAATAAEAHESGGNSSSDGGGGVSGDVGVAGPSGAAGLSEDEKVTRIEEGDRSSGGNRWPRQETLALLKIRSDMDAVFRDSSLKGPLWEEVSRKLAELGYHRSAKKCKEKFENVYKYHKRTKEGRASKRDGKTYRFFDQLEALENQPPQGALPLPRPAQPSPATMTVVPAMPVAMALPGTNPPIIAHTTVPSTVNPIIVSHSTVQPIVNPTNLPTSAPINLSQGIAISSSLPNMSTLNFGSISTSSSTSSDEETERRRKRKRKWEDMFQRLMREVMEKQEEMQKKFLEALERRERERVAREEAWRLQEMARMNREHELLVQERSMAAAKDAALISFLQKASELQLPNIAKVQSQIQIQTQDNPVIQAPPQPPPPQPPQAVQQQPPPEPPQPPMLQTPPPPQPPPPLTTVVKSAENPKSDNGGEKLNFVGTSSSRWPKAEVQALIRLRTNLDLKYQESGPKGPLWEEISAGMRKLGYNRSAKRCKEKWENINKYFKKVKDSSKKRPEDSKTCPYFHQLDALYRERAKSDTTATNPLNPSGFAMKPENAVPIMVQPEQQWPQQPPDAAMEDHDSGDPMNDDDDDGDDEDEEDEAGGYEIVTNKPSSVGTAE
ncbi:hypothetical protein NMG60_11017237 [Bertholletia excelsa]